MRREALCAERGLVHLDDPTLQGVLRCGADVRALVRLIGFHGLRAEIATA